MKFDTQLADMIVYQYEKFEARSLISVENRENI